MTTTTTARPAPTRQGGPARTGALVGLGTLVRFNLRRDRVRLPVWILAITATMVVSAASFPAVYPDAASRAGAAVTINNPGTTALVGAIYSADDYTYGVMLGHETVALGGVIAALMSIFTLVRHTRTEEETGRAELVRSSTVGRHASAVAALVVVVAANVVLALALAAGLGMLGIESIDWGGSLLYGAALAAAGLVFTGVAAVTVQLTEHARGASGLAGLLLGVAFALRAAGDVGNGTLTWFSPLGWSQKTYVFDTNEWAPLGISVAVTAALVAVAVPLSRRRDVGSGLMPQRSGRATASRALASPLGLAVRLNRANLLGWAIGLGVFGAAYGPVLAEADSFLEDMEIMGEFLPDVGGASGSELFASVVVGLAAMLCAVPAAQVMMRLRGEESSGRAEPLLATPVSRVAWVLANVAVAIVGGALVLTVFGLAFGASAAQTVDDPAMLGAIVGAAWAYLPSLAVVVGVATALFGRLPRATGWTWAVVVLAFLVLYFGELLRFPQWLINLSPYSHVPPVPAMDLEAAPLLWLGAIAVLLVLAGLAGIRRRSINVA